MKYLLSLNIQLKQLAWKSSTSYIKNRNYMCQSELSISLVINMSLLAQYRTLILGR